MNNQSDSTEQTTPQTSENSYSQLRSNSSTEKQKTNFGMLLLFLVIVLFLGVIVLYIIDINKQSKPDISTNPSILEPTSISQNQEINDVFLAFVKDSGIYVTNSIGESSKILELEEEEFGTVKENLYMKLSPNRDYLAYIAKSGGVDSAVKIVDLQQKQIIHQEVYGRAEITDFSWSSDSKELVVAVNLKNDEKEYLSTLYLIDATGNNDSRTLFDAENIEITQVEWPEGQNVYYSRVSYAPEQNTAIVAYNLESDLRVPIIIESTTDVYNDISEFTIRFLVSRDNKNMLAYVSMKDEEMRYRGTNYDLKTFSLPNLDIETNMLEYVLPRESIWYQNYIVGIEQQYGSPDSDVVLVTIPQQEQSLSLMSMGPRGSFNSVKLLEQDGKTILIVWSEFDDVQKIQAYDFENLIEARRQNETVTPLWELTDASSFDN